MALTDLAIRHASRLARHTGSLTATVFTFRLTPADLSCGI